MSSLKSIDKYLRDTSTRLGARFTLNNGKGMWLPSDFEERSIRWNKADLNYLIQIFPTIAEDKITGWNFWQVATADIGQIRFWKQKMPIRNGSKQEIVDNIEALVSNAISWLSKKNIKDLKPATKLPTT